ncbi:MAG TPA: hypothetical protein VMS88_06740, partial [Terriglobales bacterium]|nr:hypothetical protein [Terriglobales bacterium]
PAGGRGSLRPAGPGLAGAVFGMIVLAIMAAFALLLGLLLLPFGGRGASVRVRRAGGSARASAGTASGPPPDAAAGTGSDDGAATEHERSYAEVIEAWPIALLLGLTLAAAALAPASAWAKWLVPMDNAQTDHLKAYGLTFWVLQQGHKAEWLLNYRAGSFLLPDDPAIEREANVRGVAIEAMSGSEEAAMRAQIADNNMEAVALEKAPKVAVYIPPNTPPWDDAVTLALDYAEIPYARVWDEEVLRGELTKYDWLHLHHEDFTGQHGKFYGAYHNFPWYQEEERVQKAMAAKMGFAKVTQLKAAVAQAIKDYIGHGGFMFGMCSATDTYDIALAAQGVDIADTPYDGDPPDPQAQSKLDESRTLAFKGFHLEIDPYLYKFSDIDVTQDADQRGPNSFFTLFDFSAKNDPVPTMLVQDHLNAVPEFLGQTTGFHREFLKSNVLVLGEVDGTDEVKYIHGQYGRGTFTYLGGHDPEDFQHRVGDPPTDLSQHKHSPGYRLILNNVLFPAAERKKQRT